MDCKLIQSLSCQQEQEYVNENTATTKRLIISKNDVNKKCSELKMSLGLLTPICLQITCFRANEDIKNRPTLENMSSDKLLEKVYDRGVVSKKASKYSWSLIIPLQLCSVWSLIIAPINYERTKHQSTPAFIVVKLTTPCLHSYSQHTQRGGVCSRWHPAKTAFFQ